MSDDRQHEYVPPVARDILDGQRIAAVAAYAEARAEANNMAEALRVVNARLVEVTAKRDAARAALNKATAKRDWTHDFDMDVARLRGAQLTLAQNRIEELEHQLALSPPVRTFADPDFHKLIAERDTQAERIAELERELTFLSSIAHFMPEPGLSLLRPTATPAALKLQKHILRLWRLIETADGERDAARNEVAKLERDWSALRDAYDALPVQLAAIQAELNAARQSRKRAVLAAQTRRFHVSIEKASVNHYALGETVERARAEKAEAGIKKALSQLWTARDERDTARQSRKRAVSLVAYLKAALRVLNHDFDAVEVERKAALERVTELEMQRNIFGEQVELDLLQGRTLTARCAEYVASATFDVAGVAMEKVPAVPLGQALDELNQTAGELAESEDDDDIEEWQLDLARLEAVTAMFHAEQPDPCAAVRAELKAARQWARAWKAKAKQLRAASNGMYQTVVALSQAMEDDRR